MRRRSRSVQLRAAAIGLALLADVLVLLLFGFGSRTSTRESVQLQFVSIWPADRPPPNLTPSETRQRPQPAARPPHADTPQSTSSSTAPIALPETDTTPQHDRSDPTIDWYREAAKAATRNTDHGGQSSTFSPPPKVMRKPCKPKESSFEWTPEEKKAGLLPLPYVRLGNCVVGLGFFGCALNGTPAANGHLFDDLQKGDRPESSVPDPHICE